MWPFKRKKSKADIAVEWMPRAIEVATQKWLEFESQPFASAMALDEKLHLFSVGLGKGLKQWKAYENSPDSVMLLFAAKGAEHSKTHLRIEIETALGLPLPEPHVRTDWEETEILMEKIIDRASRKWSYQSDVFVFKDEVTLRAKIEGFKIPFIEGVRNDFPMLRDAPDNFFDAMIGLGITRTGTHTLEDVECALDMQL